MKQTTIAVVGSGYVGLVAAVCFADLGHRVLCVDVDEEKIKALQAGIVPIHEKYLPELLERHSNTNVIFTTSLAQAANDADVIFIAVGTPQSNMGHADLSYVEAAASEIARSIDSYKVIVEKSTVPVYTSGWITRVLERNGVARELFDVASNPEFLREGTAVMDFMHPDRIVVGADSQRAATLIKDIYLPLTTGSYYEKLGGIPGPRSVSDPSPILQTSTKSAEIIKHASNAFLAMKISFINAVSNLCDAVSADIGEVSTGMGLDSRIGQKFLRAGIGYGGSCFPKDVAAFRVVAEQAGLDFGLLAEVQRVNELQKDRYIGKIRSILWTLRGKKLALLGLAFKGDTDDIRDSPAIEIAKELLDEGCSLNLYDPAAMDRCRQVLPASQNVRYAKDAYDAARDADALLILTEWSEFASLDLSKMYRALRYPIVIDGRNLYDPEAMDAHGFTYVSMGRTTTNATRRMTSEA